MSESYVLDASAILCNMFDETGGEHVEKLLDDSVVSAVNFAEVISKLQDRNTPQETIDAIVANFKVEVIGFDLQQSLATGRLRNITRGKGLSLGDRACLALAASRNATAVTTDRAWKDLPDISRVLLVR